MYWKIGERINREVLGNQRAEYGKQIVATASRQLQTGYGEKGFDEKNIRRMMQFASLLLRQIQKSLEVAKARFDNYIEDKE